MKQDLGKLLLENGQITAEELEEATQQAAQTGEIAGTVLLRLGLVNEDILQTVLELQYAVNYLNLKKIDPDRNLISLLPWEFIINNELIPISKEDSRLTLAMVNPSDNDALAKAKIYLADWQIRTVVCSDDGFKDFVLRFKPAEPITRRFHIEPPITVAKNSDSEFISIDDEPETDIDQDAAMVRLCNHILSNAISRGCTNIHIEPAERQILVHYRKEGVLFSARKLPRAILPELINKFKNMSSASASQETLPYDGRLSVRHEGESFLFPIIHSSRSIWGTSGNLVGIIISKSRLKDLFLVNLALY